MIRAKTIQFTTSRLILRPVCLEDFDSWATMMLDPETTRFLGGPKSRARAWEMFRVFGGGWYLDGFSCFSVLEKASGRWVGYAGILSREEFLAPEAIAGIVLARSRQGYVSEAITAVLDWAFEQLGFAEVMSHVAPDDVVGQGVARSMGATCRGPSQSFAFVPGEASTVDTWVFNREQWLQRSSDDLPDLFWASRA